MSASTLCLWTSVVLAFIAKFFGSIVSLCIIAFLVGIVLRIIYWLRLPFENPKRRHDAVIVTAEGIIMLHKVMEDTTTQRHKAETSVAMSWHNLGPVKYAWEKENELTLCYVDGQPLKLKPKGFVLSKGARQTGYYRKNVASMDEFVESLNQRFPLRA